MAKAIDKKSPAEKIKTLAGYGLTVEQIAGVLGISKRTFERRIAESEELADALAIGRAKAASAVVRTAYRMAVSGRFPSMTMFWLRCREGWRDARPIEAITVLDTEGVTQADLNMIRKINAMSTDQIKQRIAELEAQSESA